MSKRVPLARPCAGFTFRNRMIACLLRGIPFLLRGKLDGVVVQGVDVLVLGDEDGAVNERFLRCIARVIDVPVDVVEESNGFVVQLWRRVHEGGEGGIPTEVEAKAGWHGEYLQLEGVGMPVLPNREEEVHKPLEKGRILARVMRRTNTHVFLQDKDANTLPEGTANQGSAHGSILVVVSDHWDDMLEISRKKDDLSTEGKMC
ncbi:hypothetical protein VYU27_010372 [Nannochloropsis oceanica]